MSLWTEAAGKSIWATWFLIDPEFWWMQRRCKQKVGYCNMHGRSLGKPTPRPTHFREPCGDWRTAWSCRATITQYNKKSTICTACCLVWPMVDAFLYFTLNRTSRAFFCLFVFLKGTLDYIWLHMFIDRSTLEQTNENYPTKSVRRPILDAICLQSFPRKRKVARKVPGCGLMCARLVFGVICCDGIRRLQMAADLLSPYIGIYGTVNKQETGGDFANCMKRPGGHSTQQRNTRQPANVGCNDQERAR